MRQLLTHTLAIGLVLSLAAGCRRRETPPAAAAAAAIADTPLAGTIMGKALEKATVGFRADHKGTWTIMVDQDVNDVHEGERTIKNFGAQFELTSKGTPPSSKPVLGDGGIMIYGTAVPQERGNPKAHYQIEFSKLEITSGRFEDLTSTDTEEFHRKVGKASGKISVTTTGASAPTQFAGTFVDAEITYLLTEEQKKKGEKPPPPPLVKPASKSTIAGTSLSTITESQLLDAFKKAGWDVQKGHGGSVSALDLYEGVVEPLANGRTVVLVYLTRPAAKPGNSRSVKSVAPEKRARDCEKDHAACIYDKDADVLFSIRVEEGGTPADAKALLAKIVKTAP